MNNNVVNPYLVDRSLVNMMAKKILMMTDTNVYDKIQTRMKHL